MLTKMITIATVFNKISMLTNVLPDVDTEVLVYDGVLDDTVKAALDYTEAGKQVWVEQITGEPLPDPQYWAEVPFPGVKILPELPKKGETVDNHRLLNILRAYGKDDIVAYLAEHGFPENPFISDGCSLFPDKVGGHDLYPACFFHDVRYWCGMPGHGVARLLADAELTKDVAAITGDVLLARTMFNGVAVGGSDKIDSPFCWGFGRQKKDL